MTTPVDSSTAASRVFSRNRRERELLETKHLVMVGLGSAGSALAVMAARAGIGRLTLIDPEAVAPENIGRHFCDLSSVNEPKVNAVARLVRAVNPETRVETYVEDFRQMDRGSLLHGVSVSETFLVATTDSFECQSLVNLSSLEMGLSAMFAGCWGEASTGEVLCVIPGRTPCYECYARFRRTVEPLHPSDPRRYTDLDFDASRVPGQAGLWPNILVICGFAFQLLLGLLDPARPAGTLIDDSHTLFLVNVEDFGSALQPWAVTRGRVERGCTVCDESRLATLVEF